MIRTNRPKIILASASPRRRDLLRQIGISFRRVSPATDETWPEKGTVEEAVVAIARRKAESAIGSLPRRVTGWVLGVDTVIETDGRIIGKPADKPNARRILRDLEGRTHRVLSGLALLPQRGQQWIERCCISEVTFRSLSEVEIDAYLDTQEWRDAAGAYRIQETGALLVDSIKGSYSNIVGLPLSEFYGMLRLAGYPLLTGGK